MVKNVEEIEREAKKVLEELSKMLEEINLEEEFYIIEKDNLREDDSPENEKNFKKFFLKNAPKVEDGYVVAEVATWLE